VTIYCTCLIGGPSSSPRSAECPGFIAPSRQYWLVPLELASRRRDARLSLPWCDLRVDTGRYACPLGLRRSRRGIGTRSSPESLAHGMAGACASLPGIVEIGLFRPVEAEVRELPLAGYGLDPVLRFSNLGWEMSAPGPMLEHMTSDPLTASSGAHLIVETEPNPEHIRFLEGSLHEFNVQATASRTALTSVFFCESPMGPSWEAPLAEPGEALATSGIFLLQQTCAIKDAAPG
jgi:hypothetical protein